MPQVIRPSNITIVNGESGVGKLIVTLELNINLNANGVQASVAGIQPASPKVDREGDDSFAFEIPDFGTVEKINFGKKV